MKIVYTWRDLPHRREMIRWRGESFIRAINKTRRHSAFFLNSLDFVKQTPDARRMCEISDIIVIHQDLWGERLGLVQHWKARGKVVISDLHIDVKSIDGGHPEYDFWMGNIAENERSVRESIPPRTQFNWGLQLVDAATTQKIRLVNECGLFASVHHIPHFIDIDKYSHHELAAHEGLTLGWKGYSTKELQETGLNDALTELLGTRDEIRLIVFSDQIKESDFNNIPAGKLEIYPLTHGTERWLEPMGLVDIGLVPQCQIEYGHDCEIDALEWMAMRIPWIGTKQPGGDIFRYGNYVKNSKESWRKKILEISDNLLFFQGIAKRESFLEVIGKSLDENVQHLINTYAKIINQSKAINYSNEKLEYPIAETF